MLIVSASLATHHAYNLARCATRLSETLLAAPPDPSTASCIDLTSSSPPTVFSPRSRRKSHRRYWSVIWNECDLVHSRWATSV